MRRGCWLVVAVALAGCAPSVVWRGRSGDGLHRLEVTESGGLQGVRIDGVARARGRGVGAGSVQLSVDARHNAYALEVTGGWVVVHDGQLGPLWDAIAEVRLSPDGQHVAAVVQRGERWAVAVDGLPGPDCDAVLAGTLRWSGVHLAHVGERLGAVRVTVDGVEGESWDAVGLLEVTPEGDVAYAARRGREAFLVTGGQTRGPYAAIAEVHAGRPTWAVVGLEAGWTVLGSPEETGVYRRVGRLQLSPSDGHPAYVVSDGEAEWVVDGSTRSGPWQRVQPDSLAFSPDGRRLGFAARRADGWRVVADGREGPPFEAVEAPVLAGPAVGYLARLGEESTLVLDGVVRGGFREATGLALAPGGRRYAFVARRDGGQFLVVDGEERAGEGVVEGTLVFSSDGSRLGWAAATGGGGELLLHAEGGVTRAVDGEELRASAAREGDGREVEVLRRWVAAALEVAEGPHRPSPR